MNPKPEKSPHYIAKKVEATAKAVATRAWELLLTSGEHVMRYPE